MTEFTFVLTKDEHERFLSACRTPYGEPDDHDPELFLLDRRIDTAPGYTASLVVLWSWTGTGTKYEAVPYLELCTQEQDSLSTVDCVQLDTQSRHGFCQRLSLDNPDTGDEFAITLETEDCSCID